MSSVVAGLRLNSCAAWALLLCGMWDLLRPGVEPVSPELADGLFTTEASGKPPGHHFFSIPFKSLWLKSNHGKHWTH